MEEFKESVRRGFKQCRGDIDSLKIENDLLKEKLNSLGSTNSNLQNTISELNAEMKGIKIALDYIKSFNENSNSQLTQQSNNINNNNNHINNQHQNQIAQANLNQNLNQIQNNQQPVQRIQQNYQSIPDTHIPRLPVDPYQALVEFKAKSNKRELLKQKLVSMINQGGMNLSELKFMFVDHNRYVSKATFYNYLKELEAQGTITQEYVHGKKHIFANNVLSSVGDELNSR